MHRILIAGFQHETNTFAPIDAQLADFHCGGSWPSMTFGQAVIDDIGLLNIPLGGFVQAAKDNADLIPVIWTQAEPSAHVSREAFDYISGVIVDAAKDASDLDGIYLDLHGAMVTVDHFDGEAELLRRLRVVVGDDMPIAVSLDYHANISPELAQRADCLTIYRTYPHLDMDDTGARAWPLLRRMIETGVKPARAFRQVDILVPLSAQCTEDGPLAELFAELDTLPDGVTSADLALGFTASDIPDVGPSVVVYGDHADAVNAEADRLAIRLSEVADQGDNTLLSPQDAVRHAMEITVDGGMALLADVQDNSGAGAMSDTTGLLAALVAEQAEDAVMGALWDPDAASAAHAAGAGAELSVNLGGRHGPDGVVPFPARIRVLQLTDGHFRCTGEMQRDVETDIGKAALLEILDKGRNIRVLVSSLRHQAIDQELFRHMGVEPGEQRIVAVKSTVHYRADYAPAAKEVIRVDAPGHNPCVLERVNYQNLRPGMRPSKGGQA